jgi:hypothetical protein
MYGVIKERYIVYAGRLNTRLHAGFASSSRTLSHHVHFPLLSYPIMDMASSLARAKTDLQSQSYVTGWRR